MNNRLDIDFTMSSKGGGNTLVSVQVGHEDLPKFLDAVIAGNPAVLTRALVAVITEYPAVLTQALEAVIAEKPAVLTKALEAVIAENPAVLPQVLKAAARASEQLTTKRST